MTDKQIALITGGSRGIGKACALELAKAGYNVVINYIGNDEAATQTVAELKELGAEAYSAKFDVTNKEAVEAGVAEVDRKSTRLNSSH